MTTKEIIVAFLIWWGAGLVASSLLWLNVVAEGANAFMGVLSLAAGVGLLVASIVVWKMWKE